MTTSLADTPELTKNQSLVFDTLTGATRPLSAYSILDLLRDEGLRAPLQVYRALDKLQEAGLVHRLESLNAFIACRQSDCCAHPSVAFAICEICGQVREYSDDSLSKRIRAWAKAENFALSKTTIELRGVCQSCAEA